MKIELETDLFVWSQDPLVPNEFYLYKDDKSNNIDLVKVVGVIGATGQVGPGPISKYTEVTFPLKCDERGYIDEWEGQWFRL